MTQTMPNPMTYAMLAKATDGSPVTNPAATYPTLATVPTGSGIVYHPNVWSEKVKNHPGSSTYNTAGWENITQTPADPDFTNVVLVAKSMNQPY